MANVKISALPAATAINAADLLPVVQGGVTKHTTPDLLPVSTAAAAALAGKDASGAAAAAQAAAIQRANHTGTQSADTITDGTTNKAFLASERAKLAGIAAGATANRADTATDAAIAAATAALVNSAPGTLDTLGELATALTADESAAATLTTLVGTKAPLASPTFTGTPTISGTAVAKMSDVTAAVTAQTAAAAATYLSKVAPPTLDGVSRLRATVRGGAVTTTAPIIAIGDSHTDASTAAQYLWQRLQNVATLPGNGLEGVPAAAIVPQGNNGQKLADYLHANTASNTLTATLALNPVAIIACWLTNDVRQGGLGTTVTAIRAAGAALLDELIDRIQATNPGTAVILRVPFPYTTVDGGEGYLTDGAATNPAGLAQIYTDGVRLAHYDAQRAHPDVILYDPQTRLTGTVAPTANGGYYGNQIHQSQDGYEAEADDFAAFISAQQPYQAARAHQAAISAPLKPWLGYYRDPEDTNRYVRIADGLVDVDVTAGATLLDMQMVTPPTAVPNNLAQYDVLVLYGARTAMTIPSATNFYRRTDTIQRILLGSGSFPALPGKSRIAVYRQIVGSDGPTNTALYDTSYRYKRSGRVVAGGAGYVDLGAFPLTAQQSVIPMNESATTAQNGDVIYVEGHGTVPITLSSGGWGANGNNLRIYGGLPDGFDYSTVAGNMFVLVGNHA